MRATLPAIFFTATLLGGLGALAAAFEPKAGLQPGTLSLVSEPPGAEVLLDGKIVGKTPLSQQPSVGSHKLTFRLAGYAPAETVIDWRSEQNQRVHQRLIAQSASLRIREAGQARLRLGPGAGRPLEGKGPWKLDPGQYELTAVRDKIPAKPRRFELKPGQTLEIALDWPTLPTLPTRLPVARPARPRPPAPTYLADPPIPPSPRPRYQYYQPPRPTYRPPARPAEPLFTPIPPSHYDPPPAPPSYPAGPEPVFTPLP